MRKAIDADKAADRLGRAADAVGSAGISCDDPEAVTKLRDKLAGLEADRELMKGINKAWRSGGWDGVRASGLLSEERVAFLQAQDAKPWGGRGPFPRYVLTNLGGNITRIRQRIAALTAEAARQDQDPEPKTTRAGEGFRVVERSDLNRVTVVFDSKPDPEVCSIMRCWGFRFSRHERAWMRHLNNAGRNAATIAADQIERRATLAPG